MKTILRMIPVFILLMGAFYYLPLFISRESSEIITEEELQEEQADQRQSQQTEMNQQTIPVSGIGIYIGQPIENFSEVYGEPSRINPTINGYEWWIYGTGNTDYLQVGVDDGEITTLFALGLDIDVTPFEIGTPISGVYQITTVYPTFEIDYQEEIYQLELSENDFNYQPLIAFDNQTFAALTVDRETSNVTSVRYFDTLSLLQADIYELASQTPIPLVQPGDVTENELAVAREQEVFSVLNVLRSRLGALPLVARQSLSELAESIFRQQENQLRTENVDSSLSENEQADEESNAEFFFSEDIEESETDEPEIGTFSPLTSEQIQEKLEIESIPLEDVRVLYFSEANDPSWLITYLFSLEDQRNLLMDQQMEYMGMAYRNNELLLILGNESIIGQSD